MGDIIISLTLNGYSIYKNNGYCLCVPNKRTDKYQLYVGFTSLNLKDLSRGELVKEVRKNGDLVHNNKNGIYVLVDGNKKDNQIKAIMNDLMKKLKNNKIDVKEDCFFINKNDYDKSLIDKLSKILDNVTEVEFETLKKKENGAINSYGYSHINFILIVLASALIAIMGFANMFME